MKSLFQRFGWTFALAVTILKSGDMVQWLREQGLEPVAEQAKQWLSKDIQRWKLVVQAAGIKPE